MPVDNAYRINEMFMEMVHKFSDTVFQRPGVNFSQVIGALDGFLDFPFLIGIHHQLVVGSNFFTNKPCTAQIVGWISSNLQFEMGPSLMNAFAAQPAHLVVAKSKPA